MACEKLLTISIAAYNVENYIEETLDSIIVDRACMDKLDIIVVNDGSADRTSELAHAYANRFPGSIRVIDKANGGYGSTINASLAEARGRYYKLLDGDDWFVTENIPALLDYLEEADAELIRMPFIVQQGETEEVKLLEQGMAMFELAVKTDCLRSLNHSITENCFYTDNEFVLMAEIACRTAGEFDKPVYRYRLGVPGQSISVEGRIRHREDWYEVCDSCFALLRGCEGRLDERQQELADILSTTIIRETYIAHMLAKEPVKERKKLLAFDDYISGEYPDRYLVAKNSRLVRNVRISGSLKYLLLCMMIRKWKSKRTI